MAIQNFQSPGGGWGWVDPVAGVGFDPNGGSFTFTPGANPMVAIGALTGIVNDARANGQGTYGGQGTIGEAVAGATAGGATAAGGLTTAQQQQAATFET